MVAWMWALGDNSIQISGFDDGRDLSILFEHVYEKEPLERVGRRWGWSKIQQNRKIMKSKDGMNGYIF